MSTYASTIGQDRAYPPHAGLVAALHAAASPDGRPPGRAWPMASIANKRAENEE